MTSRGFSGDYPRNPQSFLSPELAVRDPIQYKERLFDILSEKAPIANAVMIKLFEKGIWAPEKLNLLRSPNELSSLDLETHEIDLNPYPLSPLKKEVDIYKDEKFQGDMETVYVFNHELSHLVSKLAILGKIGNEQVTEDISSMTEAFLDLRKSEPGMALTRQGTVESYKEEALADNIHEGSYQALEDIAELINMFTLDPQYLKEYLQFLTATAYRTQKRHLRLKEISEEVANLIYSQIEKCVKTLLEIK